MWWYERGNSGGSWPPAFPRSCDTVAEVYFCKYMSRKWQIPRIYFFIFKIKLLDCKTVLIEMEREDKVFVFWHTGCPNKHGNQLATSISSLFQAELFRKYDFAVSPLQHLTKTTGLGISKIWFKCFKSLLISIPVIS